MQGTEGARVLGKDAQNSPLGSQALPQALRLGFAFAYFRGPVVGAIERRFVAARRVREIFLERFISALEIEAGNRRNAADLEQRIHVLRIERDGGLELGQLGLVVLPMIGNKSEGSMSARRVAFGNLVRLILSFGFAAAQELWRLQVVLDERISSIEVIRIQLDSAFEFGARAPCEAAPPKNIRLFRQPAIRHSEVVVSIGVLRRLGNGLLQQRRSTPWIPALERGTAALERSLLSCQRNCEKQDQGEQAMHAFRPAEIVQGETNCRDRQ